MAHVLSHLKECRYRLLWCILVTCIAFIPVYMSYPFILKLLLKPFQFISRSDSVVMVTSIFEGFLVKLRVSVYISLLTSSPFWVYHGIRFIYPGLTYREKKFISIAVMFGFLLSIASIYMTYFHLLPAIFRIMTSLYFIPQDVMLFFQFSDNIFYIVKCLMMGIIAFQLPVILEGLLYLNLVSRRAMIRAAKWVILGIIIFSAMVTPPDVVSQLMFAIPLILLYFCTILIAKIFKFGI